MSTPPTPGDGQHPAADLSSEAATLTACMNRPAIAALAMSIAGPDDYYSGVHREIAIAVVAVLESGKPCEPSAVMLRLRETKRMPIVGGESAIVEMMNSCPAVEALIERYAGRIRNLSQVRRLGDTMRRLTAETYQPIPDVPAFLARVDAAMSDVTRRSQSRGVVSALDAAKEVARDLSTPAGKLVTTGFGSLDRETYGFEPSCMYVLGARTGMGKTAIAMQMARATAEAGNRVLVCSLEMPRTQLVRRMICSRSGVPLRALKARNVTPNQWSAFMAAASDVAKLPIDIADGSGQTLLDIKASVRSRKPDVLFVDHIGLIRAAPGSSGAKRSREQEVAEFSRGLKALALECEMPVVVVCQVGREVAKGARRPQLADLRESGAIEQDADGVWFLHRPGYYDPNATPDVASQAELIVAKQRDGETPILPMRWEAKTATFSEVEDEHRDEYHS